LQAAAGNRDAHLAVVFVQRRRITLAQLGGGLVETVFRDRLAEQSIESFLHLRQCNAILRAFRPGQRRLDGSEVEFHHAAVIDAARLRNAVQILRLEISGERIHLLVRAPGVAHIVHRHVVHREEAHRRAVFRRHVGDGGAIRHGQRRRARAEKLDELADHFLFAQQLGDGQHQIGGGHALAQLALEMHTDHIRREKVHRLAEHAGFRLDAADAPADHADAVDHRGVAVGADQRVGIVHTPFRAVFLQHAARQIFEIDLMHDADAGRHDLEGIERLHAPFHELVALGVALEFHFHVEPQRIRAVVVIDLDRVIHHQVHRHQRFDDLRVFAHRSCGIAHRGEIGEQRHTGEILQHDARHDERDLLGARRVRLPAGELAHMPLGYLFAVAVAQHRFQHDADRNRQARDFANSGSFQRGQRIQQALFSIGESKGLAGIEQVVCHGRISGLTGCTTDYQTTKYLTCNCQGASKSWRHPAIRPATPGPETTLPYSRIW
jgi:hypothetical protein